MCICRTDSQFFLKIYFRSAVYFYLSRDMKPQSFYHMQCWTCCRHISFVYWCEETQRQCCIWGSRGYRWTVMSYWVRYCFLVLGYSVCVSYLVVCLQVTLLHACLIAFPSLCSRRILKSVKLGANSVKSVKLGANSVKLGANSVKIDASYVKIDANSVKIDASSVKYRYQFCENRCQMAILWN